MGDYPITNNEFGFVEKLMPFTAIDENGVLGYLSFWCPSLMPEMHNSQVAGNRNFQSHGEIESTQEFEVCGREDMIDLQVDEF